MGGSPLATIAIPTAIAGGLAAIYLILAPVSADLAAATYRGDLFGRVGFTLWDNGWYGGHELLGYSLISPALGSLLGERLLDALSGVVGVALFAALAQRWFERPTAARLAAGWFAVGTGVELLSGRVAYGLGTALGLAALLFATLGGLPTSAKAKSRSRVVMTAGATVLAILTSCASPVAGAFLALAGIAGALGARDFRGRGVAIATGSLVPIAALGLAFGGGGYEPFAPSAFWPTLAGLVLLAWLLGQTNSGRSASAHRIDGGRRITEIPWTGGGPQTGVTLQSGATSQTRSILRIGVALYALACVGAFVLHTPVGGNATRLGATFAGPVAAGVLWGRGDLRGGGGGRILWGLLPLLAYWQLVAPIRDFVREHGDPSTGAGYYAPLLSELQTRDLGAGARVEIPMTAGHWEAVYVASRIPIARGWERQQDTRYAGLFYRGGLTGARYLGWLHDNAVSYVALSDARLDGAGRGEARLIETGVPGLSEVWRSTHWRLFEVRDPSPPVSPPGRLESLGSDSFTLATPRSGEFTVRVRFTPYWRVEDGRGCVREAPGGWTEVELPHRGVAQVGIAFSLTRIFSHGARCG